jgi:hypothetical protein
MEEMETYLFGADSKGSELVYSAEVESVSNPG